MFEILENHFNYLDSAETSQESIFRHKEEKERYETLLMYVFRKYEAANYHFGKVKDLIEKEKNSFDVDDTIKYTFNDMKTSQVTYKYIQTVDTYIYELSAFLEALKSSLDLLAEVCSLYLPGVTTNYSISPLLKLTKKGKVGPIFDGISENFIWLSTLREYRHHLVHRLMPSVRNGYKIKRFGNKIAKVYYPVVVPEKTPSFVIDTRDSRMMEETVQDDDNDLPGLQFGSSIGKIKKSDGTEEVVHLSLDVGPSVGYKSVYEFMKDHLDNYENFFTRIVRDFEKLNFEPLRKS